MTDLKNNNNFDETKAGKAYAAPKLEIFGEVSALTAAGSTAAPENGGTKTGNAYMA